MNEIFADTSGWASFLVRTERFHALAKEQVSTWHRQKRKIVTTNYVLTEVVSLLTSPLRITRPQIIATVKTIRTADWVEILHIDPTLDAETWQIFEQRPDKEWSLVDCSSFVVMKSLGIPEAFTTDHHFEQAGFRRTLR